MEEYENRIFWYALLIVILRNDLTADDALRIMGVDKIGNTYMRRKREYERKYQCSCNL